MEAGRIDITASLKTDLSSVSRELQVFKKVLFGMTKDVVEIGVIEKVDVKGQPKEFFIMEFTKDRITIEYTIPKSVPPSVRRWVVLRKALPILALMTKHYSINMQLFLNLIETTIAEIVSLIPKDTKSLYVENDKMKAKLSELEKRLSLCIKDKESLNSKLYEATTMVNELRAKLAKYEKYSDELLKSKIIEWIKEHNGELDIVEFSKLYKVPETKVEELLTELVDKNYIKPV